MITLEQPLKKRFWLYAQYVTDKKYTIDDQNIEALKKIIQTIEEQKKGIVLCGKTGSGKTFVFQVLNRIYKPMFHKKRIAIKTSDEIVSRYDKQGEEGLEIKSHNICIDELGREKLGKHYGSDLDVMQLIIQRRYNDYKMKGYLTYFTSNYSKSAIAERYGDHSFSRLNEMCEFINLGTSENHTDRRLNAGTFQYGLPEVLPPLYNQDEEQIKPAIHKLTESQTIKDILKSL